MTGQSNSLQTILTLEDRETDSDWSVLWSTTHVPGMDTAMGRPRRRGVGRRRLRIGALVLGSCLTMHTRITASALTGGFFIFLVLLVVSVALLANPLRHFEVYLGQWSMSGPGRAFRIIPMFDGIGLAICINAIVRAICCCTVVSIAAVYVIHSVSDDRLPFTYCRHFNLTQYEPSLQNIGSMEKTLTKKLTLNGEQGQDLPPMVTVGTHHLAWRNASHNSEIESLGNKMKIKDRIPVCEENYIGYPIIYRTPAFNFFYVEVMQLRSDYSFRRYNILLLCCIIATWVLLWIVIVGEKLSYGRIIWNNVEPWLAIIPWLWTAILLFISVTKIVIENLSVSKFLELETKEIVNSLTDALEIAMYIHAASTGTELILGKGLNHYANGHIDPLLNNENVYHSVALVILTMLNTSGAAMCAHVDYIDPNVQVFDSIFESSLWVLPMYSKCTSIGKYSHLMTTLFFTGLMFSYFVAAFIFIKTALHTIFEYKVKLVFWEQLVVATLILNCMWLSTLFASNGGVALLESVESIMAGITMPLVCLLELTGLLYIYRCHDFISDIEVATEDNACATRITSQWQTLPFIIAALLIMKLLEISNAEMPSLFLYIAMVPLTITVLSVPIRACHNAYVFLRPAPRHGT